MTRHRRSRSWTTLTVVAVLLTLVAGSAPSAVADEESQISFSLDRKRRSPEALEGQHVSGDIYPFLTGDTGVTEVRWWLDAADMSGDPVRTDTTSPFDYSPGSVTHASAPFDTSRVPDGEHTITAHVTSGGTTAVQHATFQTTNSVAALFAADEEEVALTGVTGGQPATATTQIATSDGSTHDFTASTSQSWLTVSPTSTTTPAQLTFTTQDDLEVGTHTAEVVLEAADLPSLTIPVTLTVAPPPIEGYTVEYSLDPKRGDPARLDGAQVEGEIYPILAPETDVATTTWWLDDPAMAADPVRTDTVAPYDLMPGSVRHRAMALDTATLPDGDHTITVLVTTTDGSQGAYSVPFTTNNGANLLTWAPDTLLLETGAEDGPITAQATLSATDPDTLATLTSNTPWLTTATTTTQPGTIELLIDPTDLPGGTHTGQLTASSETAISADLTISLVLDAAPGLLADPGSLTLSALDGDPATQTTLTVTSSNDTALPVTATTSAPWLSVDPQTTTTPAQVSITTDPTDLPLGQHTADVVLSSPDLPDLAIPVTLNLTEPAAHTYEIVHGTDAKRRSPQPLTGATITGQTYPFLSETDGVSSTSWWLDDPDMTGAPLRTDSTAPYDFTPGSVTHAAAPFDTATIPDGTHTATVKILTTTGEEHLVHAPFTTTNDTNTLLWEQGTVRVETEENGRAETHLLELTATTPGTAVTLESDAPWLRADVDETTTPTTVEVTVDPAGLTAGSWRGELVATAPDAFPATLSAELVIGDPGGCAPVACDLIKVDTPYNLDFRYESNNLIDSQGIGTGFTTLLSRPDGTQYQRDRLAVDLSEGTLDLTTTPGSVKENTLDNALGVGFDGPSATTVVSATVAGPPPVTGSYEQAGIWFGYDQDHVDRMALVSTPNGWRVEHVLEIDGVEVSRRNSAYLTIPSDVPVELSIRVDPENRQATGYYKIGDAGLAPLRTFDVPGEFFSFDGAGIDPLVGTRSFGGIFAAQRSADEAPVFRFSQFSVTGERDPSDVPDFPFDRYSVDVPFPTSLAFGPDGRLYVQSMFGKIYVLSFDADGAVVDTQEVSTLGRRLALGLTVDPDSTPEDVVIWAGHSSPSASNGLADSSVVSRLSGPDLTVREDIITGLPRSIANHGTNAIHFGSDGRLYLAQGGNTGGGASNTANTEFGARAEQPLSAALLVADVKASGFDGDCAHPTDMSLSGDCDVSVFASGLRNTYDFVEHSNGSIYGPDNGLGIVGSYPSSPTAPCLGHGDTRSWTQGGNNPGNQNDKLNLIEEGSYYGHPNPTREECVFDDGHYQAVDPLPSYVPPIADLGPNRSANGIVEFTGDAFCGRLDHDLLIANYSVGDDITAVKLSEDGRSVERATPIVGGFKDPLPLTQAPDGRIVVGEFAASGGQVTFLSPRDIGCWDEAAPLPVEVLDAGGTAIGDAMYVVGGKGPDGHSNRAYRYDPGADAWTRIADIPGPAVENPAVTAAGGELLVLGGSTGPFSGAVAAAWSYDPVTDSWSALPDLPTARGGATAQVVDGEVYVAGGMLDDGSSTDVVERLDLTAEAWSAAPSMAVARDNPGSAVVDDVLYVFGGRTRLAGGQVPMPTLGSVEALTPGDGAWQERAPMPTARRTMTTGVVDGTVLLVGGEARPDGGPFDATEQYDPATDEWTVLRRVPTGRHGGAGAVIDGQLHVVGGGPAAGASWSNHHEVYRR